MLCNQFFILRSTWYELEPYTSDLRTPVGGAGKAAATFSHCGASAGVITGLPRCQTRDANIHHRIAVVAIAAGRAGGAARG